MDKDVFFLFTIEVKYTGLAQGKGTIRFGAKYQIHTPMPLITGTIAGRAAQVRILSSVKNLGCTETLRLEAI